TNANYLLFDCGPHGSGNCGHAHADALAIEVAAKGKTALVDPGSFTYTGSPESRNWFRGADAHNVLTIDGESSSVPAGPFSWHSIANCKLESWISERRFDYVSGGLDGNELLPGLLAQTRSILFLKNDYWLMRDRVVCNSRHDVNLRFHFPPNSNPQVTASADVKKTE